VKASSGCGHQSNERGSTAEFTLADIARSSFDAAVRRALRWETVASGWAAPDILDVPENMASYMRTGEGQRIIALWYPHFRRSLRNIRSIEEWVDGDLSSEEVLSLFDVITVIDEWLEQIRQTLMDNMAFDHYEAP
jgi:hypothetical protein